MLCPSIGTQPDLFFVHLSFDRSSDQKIIRRIKIQVTDGIAPECIRFHIRFHISLQVFFLICGKQIFVFISFENCLICHLGSSLWM